jgi:antitoxin component YwqK of YwqJK toxin-antitoxin module
MQTEIEKGYWSNGKLMYEYSYVNGVSHGLQKCYFSNGQLETKYYMKDGKWHSIRQSWHFGGRRNRTIQRKNDQRNGHEIIFKYE